MLLPGETPEHQTDHADLNLSFARTRLPLIFPAVDSATSQPGERPFHHPTPRDHLEAFTLRRAADHFDYVPAVLGHPTVQPVIVILVVRPELLQARELLFGQLL